MDALSDPGVTTVVFMKSAQVGATELLNNVVGYYIDQDPAPILLLQPTLEMAQAWSKDRLAPMLRDSPALHGVVKDPKSRNSGNTMLHKSFAGGHITMAGANSPAGLASRPIRILLGDEVDRYPVSAGTEGDPVNLARKRTTTFWNRKILLTSTPTVKGASRIEMEFDESDKRYFFVPCPHCKHSQRLLWANVQWPKDEPDKAQYCCNECGALFSDAARMAAIRKGEWRATGPFNGRAGFHVNELYSPWSSMADMARNFIEAKKSPETLKTFVNTSLGETWEDQGETLDNTGIMARREEYPAAVPVGGLLLTAGVDVQGDRIEMEVVAWGEGEESWNVDYVVFPGDPSAPEVWQLLDDAFSRTYTSETGTELHITASCIDSGGHHTQIVYDYCRQRVARRVFAIKGVAGPGRPVVQISRGSVRRKRRVDLYTVGVDDAKGIIYARLRATEPGPGYCHFPVERQEEYFLQLTAEKIMTKYSRGFPKKEWVKTRTRNEALDCRVYAYAALKILNPVWSAIQRRADKAATKAEPEKPAVLKPTTQKPARPTRKRGNFVTSW